MIYRKKGRFVLDLKHLQSIVDDVLRQPHNRDVKISILKSPNKKSKSLYVDIAIEDCAVGVRISDHRCKGAVRGLIVDEMTGNTHIYYAIERAIKGLRHKRLKKALGEI
jgi:hypothetical protein